MSERGQQGDHGQTGSRGERGADGPVGHDGVQGKQGIPGVVPGGVFRLTDRRVLVLFVLMVAAFTVLAFRSEAQQRDIKQNHYQSCRDFTEVITALNENDRDIRLPDCDVLRP